MFDVAVASVFTGLALAIICATFVVWVRALPFSVPVSSLPTLWIFKRKIKTLSEGELLLARGASAKIVAQTLRSSFLIPNKEHLTLQFTMRVREHNERVLTQLLLLSDRESTRLSLLAEAEKALELYHGYLEEYCQLQKSRSEVHKKREKKGHTTPDWVKVEFRRKEDLLLAKIKTHRLDLVHRLDDLISPLQESDASRRSSPNARELH